MTAPMRIQAKSKSTAANIRTNCTRRWRRRAGNDAARAQRAGRIAANEREPQTIADGARTLSLGENNWAILREGMAQIIEVPDEKIEEAVRLLFALGNLSRADGRTRGRGGVDAARIIPRAFGVLRDYRRQRGRQSVSEDSGGIAE